MALPAGVWSRSHLGPGDRPTGRPVGTRSDLLDTASMKPARWSDPSLKLFPHQVGFTAPSVVIASDDLLDRPEDTIRAYCAAVGIPFLAEALSWEAGERPEVGWYGEGTGPWHDDLRASTGISRPTTEYPPLDGDQRLVEMLERSTPHYEALLAHRVVVG